MRASTRQRNSLPAIALLFAAAAAAIGARGGCSTGGLGFGTPADPNAVATGEDPNAPEDIPLDPDPSEASAIADRVPGTIASIDLEGAQMTTAIDDDRNVHEFVVFVDDLGAEYLGQYVFTTDAGRLVLDLDPDGNVTAVAVEDYETGGAFQVSLDWTDATHALANMTDTESSEITAFDVDLSKAETKALDARAALPAADSGEKWEPRAEQSMEQWLSLAVKVRLVDGAGDPVDSLLPAFRLRDAGDAGGSSRRLTYGVARGAHVGDGVYTARLPAYRYVAALTRHEFANSYATQTGKAMTIAGFIVSCIPGVNAVVGAGIGFLGVAALAVDEVLPDEYTFVPHPTALGWDTARRLEVSVAARDRTNATASQLFSCRELYEVSTERWQVEATSSEVDLGTLVVEPVFQAVATGYRVYIVPTIGPGQLEVLPEGSEVEGVPSCYFAGGGLDCTIIAQVEPMTEVFSTASEAALSLCGSVTDLKILPLGVGPAATVSGQDRYLSYEVYDYLATCASQ